MNGMFLCTVKRFNKIDDNTGEVKVDKNGKEGVILHVLAGTAPNRNVISGTVAEREGFELNNSYLVSFNETEEDEDYGRQFNFTLVGKATISDILSASTTLGTAKIVDVSVVEDEVETKESFKEPITIGEKLLLVLTPTKVNQCNAGSLLCFYFNQ